MAKKRKLNKPLISFTLLLSAIGAISVVVVFLSPSFLPYREFVLVVGGAMIGFAALAVDEYLVRSVERWEAEMKNAQMSGELSEIKSQNEMLKNQNETLNCQIRELLDRNRSPIRRAYQLGRNSHRFFNLLWFYPNVFKKNKEKMLEINLELAEGLGLRRESQEFYNRMDSLHSSALLRHQKKRFDPYREGWVDEARKSLRQMGLNEFALKIENLYDTEVKYAFESGFALDSMLAVGAAGARIDAGLAEQILSCLEGMHADPAIIILARNVITYWANGELKVDTAARFVVILDFYLETFGREGGYAVKFLHDLSEHQIDLRGPEFASQIDDAVQQIKKFEVFSDEPKQEPAEGQADGN